MESTTMASTGKFNMSRTPGSFLSIKTIGAMAIGAMLTASVLLSGSTASADEANRPLIKEQPALVGNWDAYADARDILPKVEPTNLVWDAYVDARDILGAHTATQFTAKLGPSTSIAVGNWDAYTDARDIRQTFSEFDTYVDTSNIRQTFNEFDVYLDARDIRPN